jgi:hypothetical protein
MNAISILRGSTAPSAWLVAHDPADGEKAYFIAIRKDAYERLHPETRHEAFKGNQHTGCRQFGDNQTERFTAATAKVARRTGAEMKNDREIWFQRAWIGGWYPIHWKGYLLLYGGVITVGALVLSAVLVAHRQGPELIVDLLVMAAIVAGMVVWVASLMHSRPWRDRRR